jgi:hypothetical protein
MNKYEIRIPRLIQMVEWETITVEASNKEDAINNALTLKNTIGESQWEDNDHETIETFEDEIEVSELGV